MLIISFSDKNGNSGQFLFNFTGQVRERESAIGIDRGRDIITLCILSLSLALTIAIVGEDVVELNESSNTLTLQLTVTGVSFGVVPLRVIPVSYSQYEELRSTFSLDSTLSDIVGGRAIPLESALPGNHGHLRYIIVEH